MQDYNKCKKNRDAENIIIVTGAYATGKPAFDVSSHSKEPILTTIVTVTSSLYGAYKAIDHIDDHNRECEIKDILSQPDLSHTVINFYVKSHRNRQKPDL